MGQLTKTSSNRIAIVFDFDETLTPKDSFSALLESCGLNAEDFVSERIQPLVEQGWEKYLARAFCLVQESKKRDEKITQSTIAKVGQTIELYQGADKLFNRLKQKVQKIGEEDIELEFYLISGGFVDIPRNTTLSNSFKRMWGCEFYYGETGEIEFMKKQMTHTEKTRYLYYISKGIEDSNNEKDLIYNYRSLPEEELYIPLDQVVYVGDGASDIPCFDVIEQYGGLSIGIYKKCGSAAEWDYSDRISKTQKISNLVPASYKEGSELVRSLDLCVESIAKRIALCQLREKGE